MVYILEIISLADFCHLGLLCATVVAENGESLVGLPLLA